MAYRTSEYVIEQVFNIIRVLLALEGQQVGITELRDVTKLNFRTVQKYVHALEKLGIVVVEPQERKNVIRLTDKGKCLAKCLVS